MSDLLRRASDDGGPVKPPMAMPAGQTPPMGAPKAPAAKARPAGNGQQRPAQQAAPAMRKEAPALGALSADIARAIDHQASIEVWERFKRGERDVFTRRLYTMQGQRTFDEIRQKYQREREFRDAVDRYVADFERLLNEVTRNGADKNAGNSYLVSDTGKVYTMLAHASGRFD
jgi:hypothetical protein